MKIIYTNCIFLFLLCLTCANAEGQRTFRILFLDRAESAPTSLWLFDGEKSQKVELPNLNLSQVFVLPNESEILALTTYSVDSKNMIPSELLSVKIPKKVKSFYLLLTNEPANKLAPAKMEIIHSSERGFQRGQLLWKNLTKFEVNGKIGEQKLSMNPGEEIVIDQFSTQKKFVPVEFTYLTEKGETRPIFRTQWSYNPRNSTVGFVYSKEIKSVPEVQNFLDFRIRSRNK